jgi:site-specific recombinase XerD
VAHPGRTVRTVTDLETALIRPHPTSIPGDDRRSWGIVEDGFPGLHPDTGPNDLVGGVGEDLATARGLMASSMATNTITAYSRDWRAWTRYATGHHLGVLPADPAHVCAFLAWYATGRKVSTVERATMAIGKAHRLAGHANPVDHEHVRRTLAGLRRTRGTAPRQAIPLDTDAITRLVNVAGTDLRGLRDRAMILVGYVGAFRATELLALDVVDVEHRLEGLVIRIRRSKTDPDGRGRIKTLPYAGQRPDLCPVRALQTWLAAAKIVSGTIWRPVHRNNTTVLAGRLSIDTLANTLTALAEKAGMNPERITTHSLRAGHVTEAKRRDAPDLAVMNQTHHTRAESVAGYVRDADPFRHTSATWLGL